MMNNARIHVFAAGLFAVALMTVDSDEMQTKKMTRKEIIAALKPGQWVKVDGIVQGDSSIICDEIRILVGNFLDDDWSLRGIVQKLDQRNRKLEILRLAIKIAEDARFEGEEDKKFAGIADLKLGMYLEVGGTYLRDRTFLAVEVDDKSERLEEEPELKNAIKAEGKVEKVEAADYTFTLMGAKFLISDSTKSRSVIK